MLKNEEIRQKYPFSRKGLNYFEAGRITCGCICTVRKEGWKGLLWLCGYCVPNTYFSQRNQVAITLSQLAKDVSIAPSFKFILHVHRQANCCSETFVWKFSERILFNTLRHLQSFVVAFIEQVQNIEKSKHQLLRLYRVSPLW